MMHVQDHHLWPQTVVGIDKRDGNLGNAPAFFIDGSSAALSQCQQLRRVSTRSPNLPRLDFKVMSMYFDIGIQFMFVELQQNAYSYLNLALVAY